MVVKTKATWIILFCVFTTQKKRQQNQIYPLCGDQQRRFASLLQQVQNNGEMDFSVDDAFSNWTQGQTQSYGPDNEPKLSSLF